MAAKSSCAKTEYKRLNGGFEITIKAAVLMWQESFHRYGSIVRYCYGLFTELAPEIDSIFPDYSIYPKCDYAIGYITRGCPNQCKWCIVPKKEGSIHPYRSWTELVRRDTDKLVLMDNNILSCKYGIEQLAGLVGSGYKIDLNQGMDARLVTSEVADILTQLEWIRYLRFSCDQESQIVPILRTCKLLEERGIKPYRVFVYLLVTDDLDSASRRVEALKRLPGINLYAQAERNENLGIHPNKAQLEFANRYVYGGCFRQESWQEYMRRKKLSKMKKQIGQLQGEIFL